VVEAEAVSFDDRAAPGRVVGMAASAGGVEAIRQVVRALSADFPAAICVTLHIPATSRSLLAPILDRDSVLHAVAAADGMPLRAGVIYVAPPDRHLLVGRDAVRLGRGPKENGTRPAADPMFRSLVAGMPASAIAADSPERILPVGQVAGVLEDLVREPGADPKGGAWMPEPVEPDQEPSRPDGPPAAFTCPECGGAVWELRQGELVRYRCRVGHSYSEETMVEAQGASVEAALWTALEVLEERGELLQRMADRMRGRARTEQRLRAGARDAHQRAALIRRALMTGGERVAADEAEA
jgi:two-component system chemotaxis response regulator CheB